MIRFLFFFIASSLLAAPIPFVPPPKPINIIGTWVQSYGEGNSIYKSYFFVDKFYMETYEPDGKKGIEGTWRQVGDLIIVTTGNSEYHFFIDRSKKTNNNCWVGIVRHVQRGIIGDAVRFKLEKVK